MKARVRLRLQQAAMRSRPKPQRARQLAIAEPNGLKRRIAALVLAHERGWSAADIAHHFGWQQEQIQAWLNAGKLLF